MSDEKEMCQKTAIIERFWPNREPDFVCVDHAQDTKDIFHALNQRIELRLFTAGRFNDDNWPKCACTKGHPQRINVG